MKKAPDNKVGSADEAVKLSTRAENRDMAARLARQAQRSLEIVSHDLDPMVYDQTEFVEAAKDLALGHSRARIRILVREADALARTGHRLLELAGRLSTFIEVRVPAPEHRDFNQALLIVDGAGYLHRELAERYEGLAHFNDPGRARLFLREFDRMWEVAVPDPNLRRLKI